MGLLRAGIVLVGTLGFFGLEAHAQQLSESQAVDFARRVEETIGQGDAGFLESRFDRSRFFDRIASGVDAPAGFDKGFRSSFDKSFSFGKVVINGISGGGTYKFLRIRENPWRAFFRLISADGALNYHELRLDVDPGGAVKLHDVYLYTAGEYLSETLKRIYVVGVAQVNRGFFDRLQGKDVLFFKHMADIQSMSEAVQAGQGKQALAIYDSLPAELRVRKIVLLARIGGAVQVDDVEYDKAMAAYQTAFPQAPELGLILFDRHFLRNEFTTVLELLDGLEKTIGGDPYIDVLRGSTHAAAGEFEKSLASLENAIAAEPSMENAYFSLVNTTLMFDQHALTAETLDRISEQFGYTWELQGVPDYAEFLASEEGKRWLQGHRE